MNRTSLCCVAALGFLVAPCAGASSSELSGSPASMVHQHAMAVEADYSFSRTPSDVGSLVKQGRLVRIVADENVALSAVSFPYARAEVATFIRQLAEAYRDATGTRLVVTSLTRPGALQPRNAHKLSVHPAGMAVDFRVPSNADDRAQLERILVDLEKRGMIDVTRERRPAHYHIAVFAERYLPYAARLDSVARADSVHSARRALAQRAAERAATLAASASENDSRPTMPWLLLGGFAMLGATAPVVIERRRRKVAVNEDRRAS